MELVERLIQALDTELVASDQRVDRFRGLSYPAAKTRV